MIIAKKLQDIDNVLIDPWSGMHCASGVILNILNVNKYHSLFLAVLWEFIENSNLGPKLWTIFCFNDYKGDSYINIFSDIFFVFMFSQLDIKTISKIKLLLVCLFYFKYYYCLLNYADLDVIYHPLTLKHK